MSRYYTRVCNFYYGNQSKYLIKRNKALPLNGNSEISFDQIELISRNSKKKISIKQIKDLPKKIKTKLKKDLQVLTKKKI